MEKEQVKCRGCSVEQCVCRPDACLLCLLPLGFQTFVPSSLSIHLRRSARGLCASCECLALLPASKAQGFAPSSASSDAFFLRKLRVDLVFNCQQLPSHLSQLVSTLSHPPNISKYLTIMPRVTLHVLLRPILPTNHLLQPQSRTMRDLALFPLTTTSYRQRSRHPRSRQQSQKPSPPKRMPLTASL